MIRTKTEFKEEFRQNRVQIILFLIICSILIPVLLGCFFCVPYGDDYYNTMGWFSYTGNRLLYPFDFMSSYYLKWQGTYFAALLAGIPLFELIGITALRWVMFLIVLFFCYTLYRLICRVVSLLGLEQNQARTLSLLVFLTGIAYLLGTNLLTEVFYWYTGMQVYTIPLSLAFLSIDSYIQYALKKQAGYLVCGSMCALFASGGALNMVALFCVCLLFAILMDYFLSGKLNKGVIIGIIAVSGALVNAMAPGNFIRKSVYQESISLPSVMVKTAARVVYSVFSDLRSGTLLVLVLILFLYGYKHLAESSFDFKYPALITLYAGVAVFITDFPFVLGTSSILLSSRGKFVEHVCITFFASVIALYWSGWAAKKKLFRFTNTEYLIIALGMIMFLFGPYAYDVFMGFTPYKMAYHIANGDFKEISQKEESLFWQLRESNDSDTILYTTKDRQGQWVNFMRMFPYQNNIDDILELKDEELYVTRYYNKNSVLVRFLEE